MTTDPHRLELDLADACWTIAINWAASLHGRRETPGVGYVRGTREAPLPVPVTTLDDRAQCTARLASWSQLVLEERHLETHLDGLNAIALTRFITTHAQWLATHEAGTEAAREITDSARKIARLARPERRDYVVIGNCPRTVASPQGEPVPCGTKVRAYPEKNIIKCPGCGHEDTLAWWESQIVPNLEDKELLTASELAVFLHRTAHEVVTEDQIRQWAARGYIRRHGRERNRTLYNRVAVLTFATRRTKEDAA